MPAIEAAYSQVFGVRRTTPEAVDYAWREEFSYDDTGSRIEKHNGWGPVSYTYSAENRLTRAGERQYSYDNNGNLTEETSGGGRKRYFYNSLNRVRRAEMNEGMARILEYDYDGLGRRIGHSDSLWGETRYGYEGLGLNPVQEVFEKYFSLGDDTSGSRNAERKSPKPKPSLGRGRYMPCTGGRRSNQQPASLRKPSMSETRSYLYKGRTPIARSTVGSYGLHVSAYGHDALGSVAAAVSQGALEERFRYDAFGGNYEGELETDERGYNGKPHDPVTGLYDYGYRDYDPVTGRFSTVDPIRDGRNWYVYTANDPVNYVDAWGLLTEDGGGEDTKRTQFHHPKDGYNFFSTTDGIYRGGRWNNEEVKGNDAENLQQEDAGLGYYVSVRQENRWHNYGHLNEESVKNNGLKHGDELKEGDYIGRIETDSTKWGNSTGPHVHYEILERQTNGNWKFIDPGKAKPLGGKNVSKQTVGYGQYPGGGRHNGVDYAPK